MIAETISPLKEINSPKNCLFLCAFSLGEHDFLEDLKYEINKQYAKLSAQRYKLLPHYLWLHHHLPLVDQIQKTASTVRSYGVDVRLNTTLKDLQAISKFEVVTIVAHFDNNTESIELSDGLCNMSSFVTQIDDKFTGVIDLSVCNSTILQDKIKERFKEKCHVRANIERAEIKYHLILYQNVIEQLHLRPLNYLSTLMKLRVELSKYIQTQNHA